MTFRLLLMRHAHAASWSESGDHGRPLCGKGRRHAILFGKHLATEISGPITVLHSSATRCQQTAEAIAESMARDCELTVEPELYLASAETLAAHVKSYFGRCGNHLVLIAHNPGISHLASHWTDASQSLRPCEAVWASEDWQTRPLAASDPGRGR